MQLIGGGTLPPGSTTIRLFSTRKPGVVAHRGKRQGKGKVTNRAELYGKPMRQTSGGAADRAPGCCPGGRRAPRLGKPLPPESRRGAGAAARLRARIPGQSE